MTKAQQLGITKFPYQELDSNGKQIYYENSNGVWVKNEYDSNGKVIYWEDSYGVWVKNEYDSNGNIIYYENSDGYWRKYEYDSNGNVIYSEDSDGKVKDDKPKVKMYSEEDMIKFAEFVSKYPDKNTNLHGEMLHAKSKYDGAERTIDLLEDFKKK